MYIEIFIIGFLSIIILSFLWEWLKNKYIKPFDFLYKYLIIFHIFYTSYIILISIITTPGSIIIGTIYLSTVSLFLINSLGITLTYYLYNGTQKGANLIVILITLNVPLTWCIGGFDIIDFTPIEQSLFILNRFILPLIYWFPHLVYAWDVRRGVGVLVRGSYSITKEPTKNNTILRDKLFSDIKQGLYNIDINLKMPENIDVYTKTKNWIYEEGRWQDLTKITEENKPDYIYIDYGNRFLKSSYMIGMLFSFNYDKKIISIKLVSIFGSFWDEAHLIKEKDVIQDYYEYLIGSLNEEAMKQIYSKDDVKHILKWIVYDTIKYLTFISLFLLLITYVGAGNPSGRNLLLGIFSSFFIFTFILGPVRDYIKYRKIISIF